MDVVICTLSFFIKSCVLRVGFSGRGRGVHRAGERAGESAIPTFCFCGPTNLVLIENPQKWLDLGRKA